MMRKLAIIVPHRNTPQKLKRLLLSIPRLPDIQVIVVDDNSDIKLRADTLSADFSWILFEENPGPGYNAGAARNVGLGVANAEWLLFADADDYFVDHGIESVLSAINSISDRTDIIFFDVTSMNESSCNVGFRHKVCSGRLSKFCADGNEIPLRFHWPQPWGKALRKNLLMAHQVRFDSVLAGNDVLFSLISGYHAREIRVVTEVVYCVTESENSLTAKLTPERALARLDVLTRATINIQSWRIETSLGWGGTYLIKSLKAPWSVAKIKIYIRYSILLLARLILIR
jgi:glycosyltransferase involved in cell wall biosynthesis